MADKLSEKDVAQFYRLKNSLYMFVNDKINAFPKCNQWHEVGKNPPEKVMLVRNYALDEHKEIIDEFFEKNPFDMTKEELDIILSWKSSIMADQFILFKHAKEHTLFLGKDKVYAVKGLMDSFKEMLQGHSPILINLIIMPFKDQLVHEGLFIPHNISIGGNMSRSIKAEAEEIMQREGIIDSFAAQNERKETNDADLLRFYMRSEENRGRFWEKIDDLIEKSTELMNVYNYEMGRINSRQIKSEIKKQGLKGHFAVLFSQVIASGKDETELEKHISLLVPEEKQGEVYTFKI